MEPGLGVGVRRDGCAGQTEDGAVHNAARINYSAFGMSRAIVTGNAQDDREAFVFTIETFVSGGFLLSIRYAGDGKASVTGAGVWPSIEKAKQIAEETAAKLLHGAVVNWQE